MAYDVIRGLLADRIRNANGEIKVHEHYRFTLEPPPTDEFQEIFMANDDILAAVINRVSFNDFQGNEDDRILRRHSIVVTFYRSFQDSEALSSEDSFNELLSSVAEELLSDRTLSGNVLCVAFPEFTDVEDLGNLGNRKDPIHRCFMKIMIDEVVIN